MPLNTPVAPTISSIGASTATIVVNPDGNPNGTYYSFQVSFTLNFSPTIMYLNTDGSFSIVPVYQNVTSLMATALTPNIFYSIALSAASDAFGDNATSYGPPATFTTLAAQPVFLQFSSVFSTQVTANWYPNNNPGNTQYYVELSTDPSFIFNVINSGWITDDSYTFIDLTPNTIYYGQVKAQNGVSVDTTYTNLGMVTTPAGPVPVMGIRATNLLANQGFLIQWAANTEPNINLYRVYRSSSPTDDSGFYLIGTTPNNVTSFVDNVPFTYGITWYYKVTALDNGNNESPLELTNPVQDMSFSQFVEQPFPTQVQVVNVVNGETPSGSIDGTNMLFTTAYPFKTGTLSIYLNGVLLTNTINYVLNIPQQFTLTSAPAVGSILRVNYLKF